MGMQTASRATRSNLAVYSRTAASPRCLTPSTIGDTCGHAVAPLMSMSRVVRHRGALHRDGCTNLSKYRRQHGSAGAASRLTKAEAKRGGRQNAAKSYDACETAVPHRGQDGLEVDPRARRAPLQLGLIHVRRSVRLQPLRRRRCCRHCRNHDPVHAAASSLAPVRCYDDRQAAKALRWSSPLRRRQPYRERGLSYHSQITETVKVRTNRSMKCSQAGSGLPTWPSRERLARTSAFGMRADYSCAL